MLPYSNTPKSQHAQRMGAGIRVRAMLNAYFEPTHLTASASSCAYMHSVHSTAYMHVASLHDGCIRRSFLATSSFGIFSFRDPQGRAKNRRRTRDASQAGCSCACRGCCESMRRGGERLRGPDADLRRRACSCGTGFRRPHSRAPGTLVCSPCTACMWRC